MSLFGSIQLSSNTLQAANIGLQVVGQNIANSNTPGYIREEVQFQTAPTYKIGNLTLGLGVQVKAIVQKIDQFTEERLRGAISDRASAEAQEQAYVDLEGLISELDDTDLSSSLNSFFASIQDILSQPDSDAARNLAGLRGQTLAQDFNRLASRAREFRNDLDQQIESSVSDINRLLTQIRDLNIRIAASESGGNTASDAVGVRDQRQQALEELAGLINIQVSEQADGSVTVFHNGEYLVSGGVARPVAVLQTTTDEGLPITGLQLADTNSPLNPTGGKLAGLITARDTAFGDFISQLDELAGALAWEFNRIFSSGQGLVGYDQLTSQNAVLDAEAALDAAGLPFTPENGSFEIQVYNKQNGTTQRTRILVDLDGLGEDTSLNDLVVKLNAVSGVTASISTSGRLVIQSTSTNQQIAFADDSSGVLAALGVNTFFTGSTASDLAVNADILRDPRKFAASQTGIAEDTQNAVALAGFQDLGLASQGNASLNDLYDRMVGEVTQASAVSKSISDGFRTYEEGVRSQKNAVSGVSLDEETVRMLSYQRMYQAAARHISTINELLEILVSL